MRRYSVLLLVTFFVCAGSLLVYAQKQTFEVTSLKAVRPILEKTISALQKKDIAGAKAAFEAYDGGWNGIEMYINRRYPDRYNELEKNYQTRIEKGLEAPNSDFAALTADAQAMLAKYDETVAMIEKAPSLSPLYDDVARLRIVRADLRPVGPALKEGNVAKARQSFAAFHKNWEPIEDFVQSRSKENYEFIENGVHDIDAAFKQDKPNIEQLTKTVTDVMQKYNLVVAEVYKDAQAAK